MEVLRETEKELQKGEVFIGRCKFDFYCDKRDLIDNVLDIFEPYSKKGSVTAKNCKVIMSSEIPSPLLPIITPHLHSSQGTEPLIGICGPNQYFTYSSSGHGNFTRLYDENNIVHYTWGVRPDLGAISFAKTEVFRSTLESDSSMLVMHGSLLFDNQQNRSIMLLGADYNHPRGNISGKTTTMLTLAFDSSRRFSFSSNDEIILRKVDSTIKAYPIPSIIPVRSGTMEAIESKGVKLKKDTWVDKDNKTNENVFYLSPKALVGAGASIFTDVSNVGVCIFTNLSPSATHSSLDKLSSEEAVRMFTKAIYFKRMIQARDNSFRGESIHDHTPDDTDLVKAGGIFERLIDGDTRFFLLSGSPDAERITKTITDGLSK